MPRQEGNEERQGHHHEEWSSGHPGRLPRLRHQNVQDRKVVPLTRQGRKRLEQIQPLFFFIHTGRQKLPEDGLTI